MRTLTSFAALLVSLSASPALAATIQTQDTIAGLQTQLTLNGFSAGAAADVTIQTPGGYPVEQTVRLDGRGQGIVVIDAGDTERAGTYSVSAVAGGQTAQALFRVLPDRIDPDLSTVIAQDKGLLSDGRDTAVVEVQLYDRFQNPLTDRPVTLIPSRTTDIVEAQGDATDQTGRQRFAVSTTQPGSIGLRAMDLLSGMVLESSAQISAGYNAYGNSDPWSAAMAPAQQLYSPFAAQVTGSVTSLIDHFEVTVPATMEVSKEASSITVRAVDRGGNTVVDYAGTVRFTSTDQNATLPNFGTYTFKPRDLGEKKFPLVLKFRTPGQQKLHVEDTQDSRIAGDSQPITVTGTSGGNEGTLLITSPKAGQVLGGSEVLVEGTAPALINIVVKGGAQSVHGDSDQSGRFSVSVPIDPSADSATFTVEDDEGRYPASQAVTVRIDAAEPNVDSVVFTPASPETGVQTLVVVKAEPKLRSVTVSLTKDADGQPQILQLLENANSPGSYQTFFTAPAPGMYQPTIQTTDTVGNVGKYLTTLSVNEKSLPTVQNLAGDPKADSVQLQWNPVDADVDGYRIYIGESPDNFLYTLDTGVPQTKATVRGLLAGHRYYFAVTALRGNLESKQRSDTLALDTIGIRLDVVPGDTTLTLNWSGVPQSLTLQSYILEYGIAKDSYTEKRLINGDADSYAIRDLINAVPYYLRLTPLLVTGEKRDDLAVSVTGTPTGDPNFHPSAGDPIPGDITPVIGENHEGAPPEVTTVGLEGRIWIPAAAISMLLAGGYFYRRFRLQQTAAFLRALEQHNRL